MTPELAPLPTENCVTVLILKAIAAFILTPTLKQASAAANSSKIYLA
ncbi:MAG: hypothetical protein U7126_09575 [Microcoleus sp.]